MARRLRRLSRPRFLFRWLGAAVVCAIAVAYVQPLSAYRDAREEVTKRRVEKAALLREQARLRHRLELAGTDAFVEREARRLGLVRPGERLYVVKGIDAWKRARAR
jgi:hypothetical protein